MNAGGYDPVSATGGANLICLTTGRGSTCRYKPLPSLKLAANSTLFRSMNMDMDFNCGGIIAGEPGIAKANKQLFKPMLATVSGRRSSRNAHGLGDNAFLPWQIGTVM